MPQDQTYIDPPNDYIEPEGGQAPGTGVNRAAAYRQPSSHGSGTGDAALDEMLGLYSNTQHGYFQGLRNAGMFKALQKMEHNPNYTMRGDDLGQVTGQDNSSPFRWTPRLTRGNAGRGQPRFPAVYFH
jgi:hypothetical protein